MDSRRMGEGGGPIGSMGSRDVVAAHGVRHLNRAGVLDGRREAQLQDACSEMAGGVLGPVELCLEGRSGADAASNVLQHCIRNFAPA